MARISCPICTTPCDPVLDKTIDGTAITSDSSYSRSLDPILSRCPRCEYWFTYQKRPLDAFYANDYDLLMEDFFQDQKVMMGGQIVGRADYQAGVIRSLCEKLRDANRLLEVGAGKGLTAYLLRKACKVRSFAVHDPGRDRYVAHWREHIRADDHFSRLDEIAAGAFDLAYTFFSLEHTPTPRQDMTILVQALRGNAVVLGAVPWLTLNPGDLLVGDHCSHFNIRAIRNLLLVVTNGTGVHAEVLVNRPLRALVYLCSLSKERLAESVRVLLADTGFEPSDNQLEPSDADLMSAANRHWRVATSVSGDRREILWGAGFYSKLIMLRHRGRQFTSCVDSNSSLVGTSFTDPTGERVPVVTPDDWLASATAEDRLWLGLSEAARVSVLNLYGPRLAEADVEVAF